MQTNETQTVETVETPTVEKRKPGRPTVDGSKRQQKIAAKAALAAAGEAVKRGRPVNGESKRQQQIAARAAVIASGGVVKPGRPKMTKAEEVVVEAEAEVSISELAAMQELAETEVSEG